MIGFAGLGKYLNERSLSLIRGRTEREARDNAVDNRLSVDNRTKYTELLEWQRGQRTSGIVIRFIRLIFSMLMLAGILFCVLMLFLGLNY